jgi:hypothetical protein
LRLGAARAGFDGHDGVQRVCFTGEQRLRLLFGDVGFCRVEFLRQPGKQFFARGNISLFVGQLEEGFYLPATPRQLRIGVDALLRLFALLQRLLRFFLVLPEIRPAGFFFEAGQ